MTGGSSVCVLVTSKVGLTCWKLIILLLFQHQQRKGNKTEGKRTTCYVKAPLLTKDWKPALKFVKIKVRCYPLCKMQSYNTEKESRCALITEIQFILHKHPSPKTKFGDSYHRRCKYKEVQLYNKSIKRKLQILVWNGFTKTANSKPAQGWSHAINRVASDAAEQ